MAYIDFESLTVQWAKQRGILPNATIESQLVAIINKVGALTFASNENDRVGIRDGVGDVMTSLIIFCAMQGINLTNCLAETLDANRHHKYTLLPGGICTTEEEEI